MINPKIILDNLSDPQDVSITHSEGVLYYVIYGWAETKKRIEIHLTGEGAETNILGILIGSSGACGITTLQHHAAPNTKSDLLVKTILNGDARFSYDGLIKIDKDAQKSNAYQRNENLLLSEKTHVDTRPELEILANDVRCTHGATVGRLNEEELFYLRSRGILKEEATQLILQGFIDSILQRIPGSSERERLETVIKKHEF